MKVFARAFLLLGSVSSATRGQPASGGGLDTTRIVETFTREVAERHAPGAVLVIVRGDSIVFSRAVGVLSMERGERMSTDAIFRIGSVTKSVTGLTAAMLAQRGALELDRPIARVDARLPAPIRRLTLRNLLTHTAGLVNLAAGDGAHDDAALGARVRTWGTREVFAPAGSVYSYSSPGYWLAGHLIATTTKLPYASAVDSVLLHPLGMTHSTFRPTMAMTLPLALDHRYRDGRAQVIRPFQDDASTWPGGSLFSSGPDLARLAIALLNEGRLGGAQVIPRDVVAQMLRPQVTMPEGGCGYSFGLSVCTRGAVHTASHYGFRNGTGTVFTLVPELKLGIVVISNIGGGILGATEARVLELAGVAPSPSSSPSAITRLPAAALGTYVNGADTLHLRAAGDSLSYRYGRDVQPARYRQSGHVEVLDAGGAVAQEFLLWTSPDGQRYLHDGLMAFRQVKR
jgi:CubicO group peptidase (beta-lactamase class C family)